MPKRLRLGRLILVAVIIVISFGAGYLLLSRPAVIYPSIHPVEVEGGTYRDVGISFRFEDENRSISIPVNGIVYLGAQRSQKDAILSGEIPDSVFIPAYYLSFLNDPNQEEFYRELTGAFRDIRVRSSLDDDEYLELMAVALFYFKPEAHMAVGVKGYQCDYKDTGYGSVDSTNLSLVGVPTSQLPGGMNLTSVPLVIPVANRTRLYGECPETMAIQDALERTEALAGSLSPDLDSLQQRMNDLHSKGRFAECNQLVAQYRAMVKEYNDNAFAHNYILQHLDDRKGTYAWLSARGLN